MTGAEIRWEDDQLITMDVARAIDERELIAYYQPVVNLQTTEVVAAEALVRWTMPDGTIVPAGLFVPSLEHTNTICGLDWCMAEQVCTFLKEAAGTPACVPTSLNFSVRHTQDSEFSEKLIATARWHGVDPHLVRVEYSAAALLEGNAYLDALFASTVAHGFVGTVDGFSQGVLELAALADKGVRVVKVAGACWRETSIAELKDLVREATERGMVVSAEGVEDAAELDKLHAAGFVFAQGFHFAKPMDRATFEAFCM